MSTTSEMTTVIITGAGLAGLFCALECVRNGFRPTVIESRSIVQTAGDFIGLGPSAFAGFKRWPNLYKAVMQSVYNPNVYYHKYSGEMMLGPVQLDASFGYLISRPALHSALVDAVAAADVPILCNKRVESYRETDSMGIITLTGGEEVHAALIIAADGIHSRSWQAISGEMPQVYSSGNAIFRAGFALDDLPPDHPLRATWAQRDDKHTMGFFLGPSSHGIMLFGHDTASWVWMHDDDPTTGAEDWSTPLSSNAALAKLDEAGDWSDEFRSLIAATPPEHIIDWRLLWRDLGSSWVSPKGRVCQVGDSAHPFLPTSVNGGTQALEDAVSLPLCLRLGVDADAKDGFAWGARVHNTLRFERVKAVQATGKKRLARHHNVDWDAAGWESNQLINPIEPWIFDHDPHAYVQEQFRDCLRCLKEGKRFVNTNIPTN